MEHAKVDEAFINFLKKNLNVLMTFPFKNRVNYTVLYHYIIYNLVGIIIGIIVQECSCINDNI
jgi:hypothetical protein